MATKKILILILLVGVIVGISAYATNYQTSSLKNIKVIAYKPSAQINEKGFQIDKYEKIESAAWINDNEVITLTKKGEIKNTDYNMTIRYCSIYNLNTKSSKDFKDVNIGTFMGVSPDKRYVLYSEVKIVPEYGTSQWQKDVSSGEIFNKNVKLLNLSTGEITNLITDKNNGNAEFIWVGKNKILFNNHHKWKIVSTGGKVYSEGSYNGGKFDGAWISGVDDIKDLGTSVEGKFYYAHDYNARDENGKLLGLNICTMDVKSKEIKTIFTNAFCRTAAKKGKTIIIDNYNNNGKKSSKGLFINRTFGAFILDENGKQQQDIKLPKGRLNSRYVLSPDGSKVAYVESDNTTIEGGLNNDTDINTSLKIIDTKTGVIKEIVKVPSLKDKDAKIDYITYKIKDKNGKIVYKKVPANISISNICWEGTSDALSFTYGNSGLGNSQINTYIVSFD